MALCICPRPGIEFECDTKIMVIQWNSDKMHPIGIGSRNHVPYLGCVWLVKFHNGNHWESFQPVCLVTPRSLRYTNDRTALSPNVPNCDAIKSTDLGSKFRKFSE